MNLLELTNIYQTSQVAFIEEELCIGCTKCIKACPFDTIIGAAKLMHTILTDACTGCSLCVPVCPMDCIEMQPIERMANAEINTIANWQARQLRHEQRLARDDQEKRHQELQAKLALKKQAISEAIARVNAKKLARS